MFKSVLTAAILSTLASTTYAAPAENKGQYLAQAKNLIGALSYSDKQAYIAEFNELTTSAEKAAFFKRVIVAETSVKNAINFALKGNNSAVVEAHMINSGLLAQGPNGVYIIDEDSAAFKELSTIRDSKWNKHVGNPQAPIGRGPVGINPPVEEFPIITPDPVLGDPSNDFGGGGDLVGNPNLGDPSNDFGGGGDLVGNPNLGDPSNDFGGGGDLVGNPNLGDPSNDFGGGGDLVGNPDLGDPSNDFGGGGDLVGNPDLGDPSNDFGGGGDLVGNPNTPAPIEDFPIVTPAPSGQIVAILQEEGADIKALRDELIVMRDDLNKQSKINNQGSSISIALSTIPQAVNGGNMLGVGIAQFESETSIAIGASTNFGTKNQHTLNFNLGKAKDTSSASIGYGFAF